MTDARESRLENLTDATGESTKSKALDVAAKYYLRMAGDTTAVPRGAVQALMRTAIEEGSVTPAEIADTLGCDELPIEYSHEWDVGRE